MWILPALALAMLAPAFADSRDWSLVDLQGQNFSTTDELGDAPTLLLFWATWCAPCKKELADHKPFLDNLAAKGIHVILISEDTPKTQGKVKPYVDSRNFTWPVLLDPDGEVLKRYGGTSLPYSVILDKDGKAVQKIRGALKDTAALEKQLTDLLGGTGE